MHTILCFRGTHIRSQPFDANAKRPLQLEKLRSLFSREQRSSYAVSACTSGSPNAMDEILCQVRQIVVDDVHDVLHVDSARSQIGGHQDAIPALLEAC